MAQINKKSIISSLLLLTLSIGSLEGAYTMVQGKIMDKRDVADLSAQEHYANGVAAMQQKDWRTAIDQFRKVAACFPDSPFGADSAYYLALSYYHFGDYEFSNKKFTQFLKRADNTKHFEDAMRYKLAIGKQFARGAKKHLFGTDKLPAWLPAQKDALEIFDEIVVTMGHHEVAADALYEKGELLRNMSTYREAVETYQIVIRKFPKNERVPEAFLAISATYAQQAVDERHNPDILTLAELNLGRFDEEFPRDPRVEEAKAHVVSIQEFVAMGLMETAEFYERVDKPEASALYYAAAVRRFPDTEVAKQCRERLQGRGGELAELGVSTEEVL